MFEKATKTQARLRLAMSGPSGSGKTFTALNIAQYLGKSTAVIDTERGSASKYADLFNFDVCQLTEFHPAKYCEAIREANNQGYEVLVIDSLSHAWFAELNMAQGEFGNWAKVKPLERALIDAMLSTNAHLIATMRSKTEWVMTPTINKKGKEVLEPVKVGTSPMQASGIEYEFDVAGELNLDHLLNISKSRCPALSNTKHLNPGQELAEILMQWLTDGLPMQESGQSKCDRVKAARESAGMDINEVKMIIQAEFNRTSPAQLTSEQCDSLIAMINALDASSLEASPTA